MRIALSVSALIIALGSAFGVVSVGAQQVIRGTLFDSLRTGAPVSGAEVVLFGTGRRDTTDAQGRFSFANLRPGTHSVGYWAPWLDSLAVPALRAIVNVPTSGASAEWALATPSRATAQQSLCGATLESGQSIVLGEVRDIARRPAAGVPVQAWWGETLLGVGQLERRTLATATNTDALGMYAICGVPHGAELQLYAEVAVRPPQASDEASTSEPLAGATASRAMSATLAVLIDAAILRQDLTVGPADADLVVSGRLVGTDSVALGGAIVMLRSDTLVATRSGADGQFRLRVPARSAQLLVRAVGYAPQERLLEPVAGAARMSSEIQLRDIVLTSLQELGAVEITGVPMSERRLAFEERRKLSFQGTFLDDEELARIPMVTPEILAGRVHRSALYRGSFRLQRGASLGGLSYCSPRIFIEGVDEGAIVYDLREILKIAKRIEVYRAAFAPPRFTDYDGCGALVIWLH